jgi:integrase
MPRANKGIKLEPNRFGVYELRWSEKGRSKRSSTGTKNLAEAEKIRANYVLLDSRDKAVAARDDGPLMVGDCIGDPDFPGADYWTEWVEPSVIDKATARYSRTKLIQHFGHLAVVDISEDDIAGYVAARRAGTIGRPSVDHTISRELSVLNAAINWAVKKKRFLGAEKPYIQLPGTSEPRDRWLTEAEADALLEAASEPQIRQPDKKKLPRVYLFVALALNTASRKTALLHMEWDQVDLARRRIYLNPRGRKQTNKRRATVPINDELLPILERAFREREGECKYVLGHPGAIRTAFENAVERAGLGPDVTPHVLRHTFGTWSAMAGKSMFDIAGMMGDTVATVTKTYAHHHPDYLRDAANNVRPSSRQPVELRAVA